MKNLYLKSPTFLLLLLCSFILLKSNIQSICIALFVLTSYILYRNQILKQISLFGFKNYVILILWFLFYAITIFWSDENGRALKTLSQQVSIVILPFFIIYATPNLSIKAIEKCLWAFILSNIIFCFYIDIHFFINLNTTFFEAQKAVTFLEKLNLVFTYSKAHLFWDGLRDGEHSFLFIHKSYFSSTFLFSIFILINFLFKQKYSLIKRVFFILIILFLEFHIYYYGSISNFFLSLCGIPFLIMYYIKDKIGKMYVIIGIILSLVLVTLCLIKILSSDNLFNEVIKGKLNIINNVFIIDKVPNLELDERTIIYNCASEMFKDKPLFGYGIDGYQNNMNECYLFYSRLQMAQKNLNPHNHFFVLLLSGGLFLLFTFIFFLFNMFKLAIKNKDVLFVGFLIIIIINCTFEAYLSRINGVLFYTIFLSIFVKRSMLINLETNK